MPAKIFYTELPDHWRKEQKLDWFAQQNDFDQIDFTRIHPDKNHNWINLQTDNLQTEWEALIQVAGKGINETIFEKNFLGVSTNRDEWVYSFSAQTLENQIKFLIEFYNSKRGQKYEDDTTIKWSSTLKRVMEGNNSLNYFQEKIIISHFRPFTLVKYYSEKFFSDRLTQNHYDAFGQLLTSSNTIISICMNGKGIMSLASKYLVDLHFTGDSQCLPLYRYTPAGERVENITDWALDQFRTRYGAENIEKTDIFHYVYAVLHDPAYRTKYELNLKRDFPRIPFYDDFWRWAQAGAELMALHVDFETVEPYPLERREKPDSKFYPTNAEDARDNMSVKTPTVKLRADKDEGLIIIDDQTTLAGIPAEAWDYQLGNRSALEWILDQYKESKIKDPTIAQKTAEGVFKAYQFADYKEQVIDLLGRVCRVSVETMRIVGEMA